MLDSSDQVDREACKAEEGRIVQFNLGLGMWPSCLERIAPQLVSELSNRQPLP